ncbi:hypothetical protein [Pseudaestuariivita rosea]|uniref:hypothetical protein n=1 Tax=Pseudaestuariivita rosea TaxID=2763263 RepID=UPI001ABAB3F1|nr:hypothetical protein [Pseudaestuariivita rosea]
MSDKSIDHLEKKVERDRDALATSLDQLSSALEPENLVSHLSGTLEGYGGELGRQTMNAAKQNPAAFALVGTGLALLFVGQTRTHKTAPAQKPVTMPEDAMVGFDDRVEAADRKIKQRMNGQMSNSMKSSRMRAAIDRGLDQLPPAAKQQVIKARQCAIKAQEAVERKTRQAARASRTAFYDNPLAIGGVALGVGALIASLLPRTEQEDRLLGEKRDALMAEADAAMRREQSDTPLQPTTR